LCAYFANTDAHLWPPAESTCKTWMPQARRVTSRSRNRAEQTVEVVASVSVAGVRLTLRRTCVVCVCLLQKKMHASEFQNLKFSTSRAIRLIDLFPSHDLLRSFASDGRRGWSCWWPCCALHPVARGAWIRGQQSGCVSLAGDPFDVPLKCSSELLRVSCLAQAITQALSGQSEHEHTSSAPLLSPQLRVLLHCASLLLFLGHCKALAFSLIGKGTLTEPKDSLTELMFTSCLPQRCLSGAGCRGRCRQLGALQQPHWLPIIRWRTPRWARTVEAVRKTRGQWGCALLAPAHWVR